MNNKRVGTAFELQMCELLRKEGFWVHFISPDHRGAQPFDIIAVKDGKPIAIDCKTCADDHFDFRRLEDNQILAFMKWKQCGNGEPFVAVKHEDGIYLIPYTDIAENGRIRLTEDYLVNINAGNCGE